MWRILKNSYRTHLAYFMFTAALLVLIRFLLGSELNILFTILCGIILFIFSFGALLVAEQYEEKHKGYSILAMLPVSDLDIVAARFLLPLITGAGMTLALVLLFGTYALPAPDAALIRSYFVLMGGASLLVVGLMYLGILGFGYTKFVIVVMALITALGFVPMVIMRGSRDRMDILIESLLSWIRGLNWWVFIPLILTIYLGISGIAWLIQTRREV
jgi:hypothetical protein